MILIYDQDRGCQFPEYIRACIKSLLSYMCYLSVHDSIMSLSYIYVNYLIASTPRSIIINIQRPPHYLYYIRHEFLFVETERLIKWLADDL